MQSATRRRKFVSWVKCLEMESFTMIKLQSLLYEKKLSGLHGKIFPVPEGVKPQFTLHNSCKTIVETFEVIFNDRFC